MKTFLTLEITEKNMKRRSLIVNKKGLLFSFLSSWQILSTTTFFLVTILFKEQDQKGLGQSQIISILVIHYCYQCLSTLKVRRHQKLVITNWRPTKQTLYFFTTKKNSLAHRGAPVGKHCSKPVFLNRRVVGILFWVTKTCFVVIFQNYIGHKIEFYSVLKLANFQGLRTTAIKGSNATSKKFELIRCCLQNRIILQYCPPEDDLIN